MQRCGECCVMLCRSGGSLDALAAKFTLSCRQRHVLICTVHVVCYLCTACRKRIKLKRGTAPELPSLVAAEPLQAAVPSTVPRTTPVHT